MSRLDTRSPSKSACFPGFLKKVVSTAFSKFGLSTLVAIYAVIGAFVFQAIERPHEIQRMGHMKTDLEEMVEQLVDYTYAQEKLQKETWKAEAEKLLKEYERKVVFAYDQEGYDGNDESEIIQWTFSGALLYSITVFTTIGYGHITPKTSLGKLVTIAYATVGIPLMLLCLANIAENLATMFAWIYHNIFCFYGQYKKRKRRRHWSSKAHKQSTAASQKITRAQTMYITRSRYRRKRKRTKSEPDWDTRSLPSRYLKRHETASSIDSYLSNVNRSWEFENVPPPSPMRQKHAARLRTLQRAGSIRRPASAGLPGSGANMKFQTEDDCLTDTEIDDTQSDHIHVTIKKSASDSFEDLDLDEVQTDELPNPPKSPYSTIRGNRGLETVPELRALISVKASAADSMSLRSMRRTVSHNKPIPKMPVSVGIIMVLCFLAGGALLFAVWEGWNIFDAAYFCFVTTTTIGFGDMVPGASMGQGNGKNKEQKLIACTVYLLFGMALIAMCFKLMQDNVVRTTKWVGRQIGLLVREPSSDEDSEEDEFLEIVDEALAELQLKNKEAEAAQIFQASEAVDCPEDEKQWSTCGVLGTECAGEAHKEEQDADMLTNGKN